MTLEVRNIYPLAATFKKVASLYEAAFPVEERLPLWQLSWNNLKNGQSFLTYFDQEVLLVLPMQSVLITWSTYSFLRLRKVNSLRDTAVRFWHKLRKKQGDDHVRLRLNLWMRSKSLIGGNV